MESSHLQSSTQPSTRVSLWCFSCGLRYLSRVKAEGGYLIRRCRYYSQISPPCSLILQVTNMLESFPSYCRSLQITALKWHGKTTPTIWMGVNHSGINPSRLEKHATLFFKLIIEIRRIHQVLHRVSQPAKHSFHLLTAQIAYIHSNYNFWPVSQGILHFLYVLSRIAAIPVSLYICSVKKTYIRSCDAVYQHHRKEWGRNLCGEASLLVLTITVWLASVKLQIWCIAMQLINIHSGEYTVNNEF